MFDLLSSSANRNMTPPMWTSPLTRRHLSVCKSVTNTFRFHDPSPTNIPLAMALEIFNSHTNRTTALPRIGYLKATWDLLHWWAHTAKIHIVVKESGTWRKSWAKNDSKTHMKSHLITKRTKSEKIWARNDTEGAHAHSFTWHLIALEPRDEAQNPKVEV